MRIFVIVCMLSGIMFFLTLFSVTEEVYYVLAALSCLLSSIPACISLEKDLTNKD